MSVCLPRVLGTVTALAIKLCFLESLISYRHVDKSEEPDLNFAVFISLTAEQRKEKKTKQTQTRKVRNFQLKLFRYEVQMPSLGHRSRHLMEI